MKSHRERSLSSSSDEDLKSLSVRNRQKEDLFSCQVVTCEFCDEAFLNRYNYLVHNANHIIIPLLRQTYFRCQECQQQCRTARKLRKHMKKRHPNTPGIHCKKKHSTDSNSSTKPRITIKLYENNNEKCENVNEQYGKSNNKCKYSSEDLKNGEIGNDCEKELELSKLGVNIAHDDVFMNGSSNIGVEIIEIESDDDETDVQEEVKQELKKCVLEREKIQNRLVFEDEEEDIINPNGLINDLMADIKVSVNVEPWMRSIADGETAAESEAQNEEWRSITVPYDDLIEPVNHECRYCCKSFPNRLSLIQHEPTHFGNKKIRRRPFLCQFCDWYISGNPKELARHHRTAHPGQELQPMNSLPKKTCDLCKLQFLSIKKHMKNYHGMDYNDNIEPEEPRDDVVHRGPLHFQKKVIKVCDLCSLFFKNVSNLLYYRNVGEQSVYGERQTCDRCGKQFFSINLVEMTTRLKERKKEKPISNLDRLKNIKNRLKMMNTIRKYLFLFYWIILFCSGMEILNTG